MSKNKRFLSLLMVMTMILSSVSIGFSAVAAGAEPQVVGAFNAAAYRRPAPDVTLDVTDVTRVGAAGDTSMGSGTNIKKATPSGVPYITGTYATQAYAGETPKWPAISFTSSVEVTITSISISGTGVSASPTKITGNLANTKAVSWEIQGGTATAGSLLKIAITYTYTWADSYTNTSVTDTYTTNGYSYVENIIFPAGVWAFASAYSNVANAADVPYVSRILGRGVYGNAVRRETNSGNEYSSGYFDFQSNTHIDDGDTSIPKKTMLIADPPHEGVGDKSISNGTGSYASGDGDRAKATVYWDPSVQTLQTNNLRMHFFIHTTPRSTNSAKDLTYETIHVKENDVGYTGGTGNVLGTSSALAKTALNPSGPVDGTTSTGGFYLSAGMQTTSTLFGSGVAGSYTLVTQWTGRGDAPATGGDNWMEYYHAVTIEIVSVNKNSLRNALNTSIGTTTKTMTDSIGVTTIVTANGTDPADGGISNTGKGKNTQSWYYSAGWNLFSTAYDDAWKTMQKPNATSDLVVPAVNNLNGANTSLVLASANYSDRTSQYVTAGQGNTYYNSGIYPLNTTITAIQTADSAFNAKLRCWKDGQYGYYTDASRLLLESAYTAAIDCQTAGYNVLYQPYVDYVAQQLQAAVNGLTFKSNTITFDANGGTGTMPAQALDAGSSANLSVNTYTKTGYTFSGWATTNNGIVMYNDGGSYAMGDSNVTLYAQWAPNNYTVIYHGNGFTGGLTSSSAHVYDAEKALNANGYARTGYDFKGWGPNPNDTTATWSNQAPVTNLVSQNNGTITIYAIWSPTVYNIVFNANGGVGTMSNQTLAYLSSDFLKQNNFTLIGHTFRGWATTKANADLGNVTWQNGATYYMSTPESKVLYASWAANPYAVKFEANAPNVTGSMPDQGYTFGQTANLNANTFSRIGYTFMGWSNTPLGAKAFNNGASFSMNTEGATLYAKWEPIAYSIAYNANGGTSAPAPNAANYGVPVIIPSAEPIRAGYTFSGWALSAFAGTAEYLTGASVTDLTTTSGATVTLYAVWVANDNTTFKIEHYQENLVGGYTLYETTTQIGTTATIGVATYKNYAGFNFNPTYPSSSASGIILGNGSLILRVYYDRISYLITFNSDGGNEVQSISGKYGTTFTPPADPKKTGYRFNGWQPILPSTMPAANLPVKAQWSANIYNVVFNGNGATSGTMSAQSITFGLGTVLVANSFIRNGYSFNGWSTTPGGGKEYSDATNFVMQTTGITLYAVWSPAAGTQFKVEHYAQSVSGASYALRQTTTQTGTTGDLGWADNSVSIPGFTFDSGNTSNLPASIILGDGSLVLKRYYARNSYDLSFSGATGVNTINAKFEQSISAPTPPVKTGYSFTGWAKDEQLTQMVSWPYSMGSLNTVFYAKWTPNNYTVTFDPKGGKISNTTGTKNSTVSYGKTYGEGTLGFPIPVRAGYTFNGWFTIGNVQIFTDTVVQIGTAQTLNASWSQNSYTVSFDLNGGTGTPPGSAYDVYGTSVSLPTFGYSNAKPGYTFLGWNTTMDAAAGLSYFSIPEGGATLYAVWQVKKFTVKFDLNGGNGVNPQDVYDNFGTNVDVSMTGFTRTGYTFGGWGTTSNATFAQRLTSFTIPAQNITTLYAIWSANQHPITLFKNGGIGQNTVQISTFVGTVVDLSSYTNYSKEGSTFVGWNTSQTATTGFWSYTVPTTPFTLLFAIYVPINNIRVTFNLNGGTGTIPAEQSGAPGLAVDLPLQGDITRQYYNFLGWATSENVATPLAGYLIPSSDTVLYAVWSEVPVTFTPKGSSTTVIDQNNGFIYGLEARITISVFENSFTELTGDARLVYTPNSGVLGTGTRVELVDNKTDAVIAIYYIVIFGDVNGDGMITVEDKTMIKSVASYQSTFAAGSAFKYAADLTQDGIIDTFDLNIVGASISGIGTINQTNPGEFI